jgi:PAS domain S-box-containing protein
MTRSGRARSARASFEIIAESIPHLVWLADASGSTDYFNERGTDYTGLPRQANYGWQWVELVHSDDAVRARLGWEHATRTATPFELSYRIRRADGQFRWHGFRALPVRGPHGEVLRWIGTADDIEDTPGTLDDAGRLQRQIAQLRAMLDAVQPKQSDRFGFADPEYRTARVNQLLRSADGPPPSPPVELPAGLTPRELTVARLVATGYTNAEIANLLGLSLRSIEVSRARLRQQLGVRTRAGLVRFARDAGLAEPGT